MKVFDIAVLPGDGIGPEVIRAGLDVLRAVQARLQGVQFTTEELSVGAGAYLRHGDPLPPAALERCRVSDAILLGAMGLPEVRWPSGVEMTPQIDLREKLDLYNGVRPIKLHHPAHTPLKSAGPGPAGAIDFVIVRENCEGLFSSRLTPRQSDGTRETDTLLITRRGAERVCRAAFRLARRRRRHVTLVDKANVLPSMAFFRKVFDEIAVEFPEVKTDRVYVDAMALFLVQRPQSFDVIVTENMFGDILSDLAAGLVGGMGMAPSADIGDEHGVFQPAHGTAPTIAGKNLANPIATILSVALMLDWLEHPETVRGARMIEAAVERVLADPSNATADLGGTLSTSAMTARVIAALAVAAEVTRRTSFENQSPPRYLGGYDESRRVIDLTLPLTPGLRGIEVEPKYTLARDGWNAATWKIYSHAGTHMDAPAHFGVSAQTIDQRSVADCMGPAWIVRLAPCAPRAWLTVADLGAVAEKFSEGESLLLHTGWSEHAATPALYRDQLPRISDELAEWCVAHRVNLLGVEPPSVADVNNLEEVTRIHRILLGGGVTIVEGLANLDRLATERVFFAALPLRLAGGDGSPVRAFAMEGNGAGAALWPAR